MTVITLRDLPSPGAYVRLWRAAFAAADAGQRVRLRVFNLEMEPHEVRAQFRRALNRRIDARVGLGSRGRNDTVDAYWRFYRDSRAAQDRVLHRVRVYQFETRAARERLGHLLSTRDD